MIKWIYGAEKTLKCPLGYRRNKTLILFIFYNNLFLFSRFGSAVAE